MKIKILLTTLLYIALATAQSGFKSLDYINSISGISILSGQHNDQKPYNNITTNASFWTEEVYSITGKYPALYGCDLLFHGKESLRWDIAYEAEKQWNRGAIINMMWHACPPTLEEPCAWDGGIINELSTDQWDDLLAKDGVLNAIWKTRIDEIAAPYLQYLKEKGVEVLWRPFHEQNQTIFWWNSGGAEKTKALWRMTHDYMTNELELNNLIWIWDVQDIHSEYAQYNPGDDYFDMAALDVYSSGFYDTQFYDALRIEAGDKPVAFGECFNIPNTTVINSQAEMSFFMIWAYGLYIYEDGSQSNTTQDIIDTYNNEKVITLDEMPGWNNDYSSQAKTIVDFDDLAYTQGPWNGTSNIISNPSKTGINTSTNVCQYITPADKAWSNCAWVIFDNKIEYNILDSIQLMVMPPSASDIFVKIENNDINDEVQPSTTVRSLENTRWQTITLHFDVEDGQSAQGATFNKMAIFFNVDDAVGNETWYYDNIVVFEQKLNTTPIANAGKDQQTSSNKLVTLDASASSDNETGIMKYQWKAPEGISLDVTNPIHPTFTSPNINSPTQLEFILKVNDGTLTSINDTVIITVNPSPTEIQSIETLISVYPNPTSGLIHLEANQNCVIKIFNITGQKLVTYQEKKGTNTIDLSNYKAGSYFIQTTTLTSQEVIRILIK